MFKSDIKILVVDDMKTMRREVIKTCKELGFQNFLEASDGIEAYKLLLQEPFDLIVSDWSMPNSTGYDLLKKVRADDRFKGIAFIMVTAEGEPFYVKDAIQAGVDDFILKPFSLEILRQKFDQVARKRGVSVA